MALRIPALLSMLVAATSACGGTSKPAADGGNGSGDAADDSSAAGCDGAVLLETPADPGMRGPWPVGATTLQVGRLTVEVWYPATPGSESGIDPRVYDIRKALPESQQTKVSDTDNPWQSCDCYGDLPIDADHGPYPVVAFVHGTAAFRTQSLTQMTHWASRGFVVVSADHPGLWLADNLAMVCPDDSTGARDVVGDVEAVLAALASPTGDLEFLAGHIDLSHIGVAGHSAGAGAATALADHSGVRAVIPMAGNSTVGEVGSVESRLFLGGTSDGVVQYSATVDSYEEAAPPKRLVGLDGAGHLAFSDLCEVRNEAGKNMLEVAEESEVCGANLAGFLFDCSPELLDGPTGWSIINHTTTAVLESTLQCRDTGAAFDGLQQSFPAVSEYREAL